MKSFFILLIVFCSYTVPAFADSLFNDDVCPIVESSAEQTSSHIRSNSRSEPFAAYGAFGLSCQDLKTLQKADQYTSLILSSAYTAAAASPSLAAELATAGLTLTNPAVATVVIVGGFGITAIKIVLLVSLDQCEQQDRDDLKQSIMNELEQKYNLRPVQSGVPLQINK